MATVYVRHFDLKKSLSDREVADTWKFYMEELLPATREAEGVRSAKAYSGAGGLVADLRFVAELDDAGVYERMLVDPRLGKLNARAYRSIDMHTSTQRWLREITPELLQGLSTTE